MGAGGQTPRLNGGAFDATSEARGLTPFYKNSGWREGRPSEFRLNCCVPRFGQMARLVDLAPGGWGAENSEALSRAGPRGNDWKVATYCGVRTAGQRRLFGRKEVISAVRRPRRAQRVCRPTGA